MERRWDENSKTPFEVATVQLLTPLFVTRPLVSRCFIRKAKADLRQTGRPQKDQRHVLTYILSWGGLLLTLQRPRRTKTLFGGIQNTANTSKTSSQPAISKGKKKHLNCGMNWRLKRSISSLRFVPPSGQLFHLFRYARSCPLKYWSTTILR